MQLVEQRPDLRPRQPRHLQLPVTLDQFGLRTSAVAVDPLGHIVGVQQHDIRRPSTVECPQHPQVLGPLLSGSERKQPQPFIPQRGRGTRQAVDGVGHREQGSSGVVAAYKNDPHSAWLCPVCERSPRGCAKSQATEGAEVPDERFAPGTDASEVSMSMSSRWRRRLGPRFVGHDRPWCIERYGESACADRQMITRSPATAAGRGTPACADRRGTAR